MPVIESAHGTQIPVGEASAARSLVRDVRAHLRLFPGNPGDFRVVVTFRRADGVLSESDLGPLEAAELIAGIARVIDQGSAHSPQAALDREWRADCD